ncbi:PREDICTED: protein O-GlcNAcase [Dufourea novaeangliae]|uniref:protein O-GlcNAcase n=1 Tax=Dufourea novaeangliae TaxID=178035 RepID=UPI000767457A|nr:PREDICTED: protein O-GlcNAcase [Dufourea novaeangliae]XP_015429237.1 PREDICTED: protein O-GlcNAcase [Dufourea novaeangliae]XP_015429238.1 PREDICTED: protein O-GlcNAcase [Dufourea novaeangliae]
MAETNGVANLDTKNGNFICGVVEGFYGRPWTTEQRKDLFQKLKKWGMDSYLYAPKDDYKHRAYWRDLYTVEEAEHLTGLIAAARECGIRFYYALSPGLDITYSSAKEVTVLKRKLEQVSQFGCTAFALLFDDIEPEMSEADKEVFQSFAHAQVSVTNDIFQHLGQPKFLLCPTQYCATRAMPNVSSSEYLNTLGSKLAQEIDIMWTGPKVISRLLTVESIEEITEVLRRPPVIWDNLHANDYDQKRVFLGPYSGRSPDLIPKLRGVLTNPNCEYGANFVAIHTLAQWSRCNIDGKRDLNDSVSADIRLETETEDGVLREDIPITMSPNIYHPRHALKSAINDWLLEFHKKRAAWGVIAKPQPCVAPTIPIPIIPSVNTCMSLTSTTTTTSVPATSTSVNNSSHLQALAEVCSTVTVVTDSFVPPSGPVMNSLVSNTTVVSESIIPTISTNVNNVSTSNAMSLEPMDCNTTPNNSPAHAAKIHTEDDPMIENTSTCSETSGSMQVEIDGTSPVVNGTQMIVENDSENHDTTDNTDQESQDSIDADKRLTQEDLSLLCDLFYLPFEHGGQGIQLLQEFNWLKSNAHVVMRKAKEDETVSQSDIEEWHTRAAKLNDMCNGVNRLFQRLTYCNNRELLYDLYSYVWDMRGVVSLLNSYVKWLAFGRFPTTMTTFTQGSYTWFSNGWKETFMSGDQEPWVFRGGLTADLQRLIPVDSGNDLFVYKAPEVPSSKIYTIRPYVASDEAAVYAVCNKICGCTLSSAVADRLVGSFLTLSPELCMVVEDESGIVGYALATLNVKTFNQKLSVSWLPELRMKYPLEDSINDMPQNIQDAVRSFHSIVPDVSEQLCRQHPSKLLCTVLPCLADQSVPKRLITCILAALRANGSFGVHTTMPSTDKETYDFYSKLGFVDLNPAHEEHPEIKTMCRSF